MPSLLLALTLLRTLFYAQTIESTPWPFDWVNQTLTAPDPLFTSIQVNLRGVSTFSLIHTSQSPIQICFQENYPVPPDPDTWNVSCTIFETATENIQDRPIPLRRSVYNIGIYFAGYVDPEHTTKDTITLNLGHPNQTCDDTLIFDTTNCVNAPILEPGSINLNLTQGPQVFSIVVPQDPILTGSIQIHSGDETLSFLIRRNGAPSVQAADASGQGGVLSFPTPRPGTYYLLISSVTTQTVQITLTLQDCTYNQNPHGSGVDCHIVFNHATTDESLVGLGNEFLYWQQVVQPNSTLRVSVASNDGTPNPRLLMSRGNLPSLSNADFTGCNIGGCGYATIIEVSASATDEPQTWYIGVTPVAEAETSYGIWLNTDCSPSCELNGECTTTGADVGKCVCNVDDDAGVGCQITSSLSKQYVVVAAIWGTAIGVTILVLIAQFVTASKDTYERL